MPSPVQSAVPLHCQVRARREALHLRSGELAAQCGITRQALHSIETGVYAPNTVVSLRLAQALSCRVEDLFTLVEDQVTAQVLKPPPLDGSRVQLAWVGERLLAFPVSGEAGWGHPADGTISTPPGLPAGHVSVQLFTEQGLARRTAVLIGCDPSLGVASSHVGRQHPDTRLLWQSASSLQALKALARGEAHAAGIHLWDARSGVSNLPFVQQELPGRRVHLYTLWSWEQGLLVARGNPHGITGIKDLQRPELRMVNRERGSGSRVLLDAWLAELELPPMARRRLPGYHDEAQSHLDAAAQVASGHAHVAPGPRSAAQALGLDFISLQTERFDLAVPDEHLTHPAIAALLSVVQHPTFRAEIASLGGYDPSHAGEHWQTTS
ncbi:helix-turn-helix domain-containing protein [Deinococcus sp. KSM4-11]|uniref:substrate-binding domain-containing protein n=1 Tax=Deinococcus sp. KSM4-11 TaxID=2568654 RepID=UPI0010A331E3|nr:substrate-binding domain-containing protein [Deinococcus sp. KSM4-11]THF85565.1 helix-turn-helix domain-containing protein [Deinococcus sp. KSM4-11]